MLKDTTAMETLAKQNKSLAQKIIRFLNELFNDIRKAYSNTIMTDESKAMLEHMDELQKLWDQALVGAVENFQENRSIKKSAKTGSKYSFAGEKSFDEQIDDVINGVHNPRFDLYVSDTPEYLINLTFSESPILMRNSKVLEILSKHSDMSEEIIKQIAKAIENPLLVLKSKTHPEDSVVIVTDILTSRGEMVIPIWANQSGNYIDLDFGDISIETNFVASAYGRNTKSLIEYAVNNNGVLYQSDDTKKSVNC